MKVRISATIKVQNLAPMPFFSDWCELEEAAAVIKKIEAMGGWHSLQIEDELEQTWTPKQFKKWLSKADDLIRDLEMYVDGGYEEGQKLAGIGVVLYFRKGSQLTRIRTNVGLEQIQNNNEAEAYAFYRGVTLLEEEGIQHVPLTLYSDSQTIIQQLNGEWPSYDDSVNRWLDEVDILREKLKIKAKFVHIERKKNKEAHNLATQALKGIVVHAEKEVLEQKKGLS
ncbi:reverse transcriptase-like protein [Mangrovibacillus cuniculi]|uniref:Reverse transcriptase-like protein n=1 Tax=Mangrovibacillus cuniculi TaxID=2593652 RepID=A0A7S8HFD6_9BACI|nr:reverse transcriptase-like protein [Mangrovibacillus cuniculi]QPC46642.1 reverse transcriptase-like protein [Mangrovibacillus cuniculi]